ncbi:hypothetical protein LZL32_15395, partial [Pseudomonas aeruginosa]|nr:hypothetical protein [Pseudomonas aeruginosa]
IHETSPQRWSTDLDDVHSSAESLLALINDQAPPSEDQLIAAGLSYPLAKEDAVKLWYSGFRSEVITVLEAWEAIGHDTGINPDKEELLESLRNMAAICNAHGNDMPAQSAIDQRQVIADAITGALAFGAQASQPPAADHWLRPFYDIGRAEGQRTQELAMLVRMLASSLKRHAPESNLVARATNYLAAKGLAGTPLRDSPALVEQAGGDERAAFELFVRKHCGMPEHIAVNWDAKFTNDAWEGWKARAALAKPSPAQAEQPTDDDYEEVLADHRRLVREMDVLLNGEACAAKQAMLCDLVSQVEAEVRKSGQPLLVSAERYRWLRNDDNWGADDSEGQGTSKWANLGELSGTDFDAYLDQLRGSNPVMDIDPEHSKAMAKRGRDAIVAQAEGAPVIGCLCGMPMTEGRHSPGGCASLEEFAPNPAQAQVEQAEGAHVPDEVFAGVFSEWWEEEGQYCRAGGGDYERTFAFQAWRHLYPLLLQARAALAQPSPVRSSLLINGYQLRAALEFIAPDGTVKQLESEARIEWRQQDADFLEAGLYAWCAEYPEEGCVLLDEEPTTAQPSPKCAACNGSGFVDDGEINFYPDGTPFENGPVKCVKDCPDCAQPSLAQAEQAEAEQPELWAVHAQGPDELYAAFSREDAEKHAAELNALPMPEGIAVGAVVVPSPWPEAEHWKYLAEQEREHVDVARAALSHAPTSSASPSCKWTESSGIWETGCGQTWSFIEDGPAENGALFCHHCGGRLVLIKSDDQEDDGEPCPECMEHGCNGECAGHGAMGD